MTQTSQPGQHPDADQLSAFAEHALPPHEQQQLLSHLADCYDCRALIFLAQEAIPAAATLPQPVAAHRSWFSLFAGWKLALPTVAALAALIFITLHLHNKAMEDRMNAMADKTARLEQAPPLAPQPPPAQPAPLKSAPTEPLGKSAAGAPIQLEAARSSSAPSFHGNAFSQPPAGGIAGLGGAPTPNIKLEAATVSRQYTIGTASTNSFVGPNAAPVATPMAGALGGPRPQSTALSADALSDQSAASVSATPARLAPSAPILHSLNQQYSAAPPLPPPLQAQAARSAGIANTSETVSVTSASMAIEAESATSSQVITGASLGALQSNKARLAGSGIAKKQPALPSNLPALITLSNARQQLALDTAGALFSSENAGVTWQPIPVQWTGRAIKIALTPSPVLPAKAAAIAAAAKSKASPAPAEANPVAAAPTVAAAKAAPVQSPIFQLINDAGQLWTSPDGLQWKHQ